VACEAGGEARAAVERWVGEAIAELLGEEEPGLVELVMEKVGERPTMVAALEPVLDAEAEAFAEKLWAVLPRGEG
jgi:RNA-binding protein 25